MDRTTTDVEVRESFQMSGDGLDFKRAARERGEAFDRWLAGVIADAKAEQRETDARIVESNLGRRWVVSETPRDIAAAVREAR